MGGIPALQDTMTVRTTPSRKSGRPPQSVGPAHRASAEGPKLADFKKTVEAFYATHGRHNLPWRKTHDPYRILVSEVMLQQTQVKRVLSFYTEFMKCFPTVQALAKSSLGDILRAWQGLGYNRRAKMLHETARAVLFQHGGKVPRGYDELRTLPGVGEYTAKAVRVFAWNEPEELIETNIRTAFLHHFFPRKRGITDRQLLQLTAVALDTKNPRRWYSALMDYGAHLKTILPNPSRRSATHARQKPFKGSDREIRGAILRAVSQKPQPAKGLFQLPFARTRIEAQTKKLLRENLLEKRQSGYSLPI